MNAIFRVDASAQLGIGHVTRCLTLADLLKNSGMQVTFVSRSSPPEIDRLLRDRYKLHNLPPNISDECQDAAATIGVLSNLALPNWLIIDHYSLGLQFETRLRPCAKKILVIDDLANRSHDCDVLLDQNLCPHFASRYDKLVPVTARKFLGPKYVLLREEFYASRAKLRCRDGNIRQILICFGGADPSNETAKTLQAVSLLDGSGIELDVTVGSANQNAEMVRQLCGQLPAARFHRDTKFMAQLMASADLAIGACGTITWERCFLGLPAITIVLADNQRPICEAVSAAGAIINLGGWESVASEDITKSIAALMGQPEQVQEMSRAALAIMGHGGTEGRDELLRALLEP